MFGLDQAAGHGKAHFPKADESDVHGVVSLRFILNVMACDKREVFRKLAIGRAFARPVGSP
jgi:hypothetical protein